MPEGTPCGTDAGVCNTAQCDGAGNCKLGSANDRAFCDEGDDNDCSIGKCESGACIPQLPASEGTRCNDGDNNQCTVGECQTGVCVPTTAAGSDCCIRLDPITDPASCPVADRRQKPGVPPGIYPSPTNSCTRVLDRPLDEICSFVAGYPSFTPACTSHDYATPTVGWLSLLVIRNSLEIYETSVTRL
jgi:hypothetical protein